MAASTFHVGVTRDFLLPDGTIGFGDIGLELLDAAPGVSWGFLAEKTAELRPDQIAHCDGLLCLGPRVTRATLAGSPRLRIIARFGVGYDSIDVDACTDAGVLLTITPDGVRRPVAAAALTLILALAHRLLQKDRLTRENRWSEKLGLMGMGVTGRTLGIIGFGNTGRDLAGLARALDMRILCADPCHTVESARAAGGELVALDDLMARSDFVCVCCSLSDATRRLVNAERIARMKPTAYLVNVARGPIVDEAALTEALVARRIAGAGLDVFEEEPTPPDNPLLTLDNVILAPHALCWTDECFRGNGHSAIRSLLEVAAGREPEHTVNPEARGKRREACD